LKGERGATKVASVVADAVVGVFNQAEIISHFVHLGAPIEEVRLMLNALPYHVAEADCSLGWEAARLRSITRDAGLSLGDRFCLALAMRLEVPAYTADRASKDFAAAVKVKTVTIR
jgi:PIN domain nuclease of toxin-antitoxin system